MEVCIYICSHGGSSPPFLILLARKLTGETRPSQHSNAKNFSKLCLSFVRLPDLLHKTSRLGSYFTLQPWVSRIPKTILAPETHCSHTRPFLVPTPRSRFDLFAARSGPRSGAVIVPGPPLPVYPGQTVKRTNPIRGRSGRSGPVEVDRVLVPRVQRRKMLVINPMFPIPRHRRRCPTV